MSETGLSAIVDTHFNLHSWHIFDKHIDIAIEIITDTLYNLYHKGIIAIELKKKEYKIGQFTALKKDKCYVSSATGMDVKRKVGWLEMELISKLTNTKSELLKKMIYDVLNKVFKENRRLVNPGKCFLLESLKNQNCNFYSYKIISELEIEVKVQVWQEPHQKSVLESLIAQNDLGVINSRLDRGVVRKIVKKQLLKFQDFSD